MRTVDVELAALKEISYLFQLSDAAVKQVPVSSAYNQPPPPQVPSRLFATSLRSPIGVWRTAALPTDDDLPSDGNFAHLFVRRRQRVVRLRRVIFKLNRHRRLCYSRLALLVHQVLQTRDTHLEEPRNNVED